MMNALAVIPARGGSKGIPGKNLRHLGGKPLLAYTAEAALASGVFDRVIFSTDSEEIAATGRSVGLETPFLRPPDLARDETPTLPVLQHALAELSARGQSFDVVCTLQPTTPFRSIAALRDGFHALRDAPSADSSVAVSRIPAHLSPDYAMKIEDRRLLPFLEGGHKITRRQDTRPAFTRNGQFYFTRVSALLEKNSIYGDYCLAIVTPDERSVNLDTLEDWDLAEYLLARGLVGSEILNALPPS